MSVGDVTTQGGKIDVTELMERLSAVEQRVESLEE